jgi:hypothetical protein
VLSEAADYPRQDSNDTSKTREEHKSDNPTARQTAHFPAEVQRIIDAWDRLPEGVRAQIVALIEAAR